MPVVYEVPTHLNVSDAIIFGLGAHQLVRLAAGASLAYLVWDQAGVLPAEVRAAIACVLVAAGVACALLQPGGRPLDGWVLAGVLYVTSPRQFAWRREPAGPPGSTYDGSDWADSEPELTWSDAGSTEPPGGNGRKA